MTHKNISKAFTAVMVLFLIGGGAITINQSHSKLNVYTDSQMASSSTLLSLYSK